jgi:hypothetical protein
VVLVKAANIFAIFGKNVYKIIILAPELNFFEVVFGRQRWFILLVRPEYKVERITIKVVFEHFLHMYAHTHMYIRRVLKKFTVCRYALRSLFHKVARGRAGAPTRDLLVLRLFSRHSSSEPERQPVSSTFPLVSGVDVMITIFCDFCPFSEKKWRFSRKPML